METSDELSAIMEARRAGLRGMGRAIRIASGLLQAEMAHEVGVSQSCLSRWENGERLPRSGPAVRYGHLLQQLRMGVGVTVMFTMAVAFLIAPAMAEAGDALVYTVPELQQALRCGRHTARKLAAELGVRLSLVQGASSYPEFAWSNGSREGVMERTRTRSTTPPRPGSRSGED